MNWKLIAVVSISLILLVVCYLTIVSPLPDVKKYFINVKKTEEQKETTSYRGLKKIKINFSKEEDFIKFINGNVRNDFIRNTNDFTVTKVDNELVAYYFPEGSPSYKSEYFLIDTDDNKENYHVPEDGYLIIVKKDHKWTKDPDFTYWKAEI